MKTGFIPETESLSTRVSSDMFGSPAASDLGLVHHHGLSWAPPLLLLMLLCPAVWFLSGAAADSSDGKGAYWDSHATFSRELYRSQLLGEDGPLPSPPPVDPFVPIRSDDCGSDKGCFRYGAPDCTADTCEYFLSYRRLSDDVEFELSAETDGWVAIGFSSDRKMGGDDVMACVYHAGNVRVQHYQTVGQWVRELRQNPARDEEGMFADGRLTCRFRRPLSSRRQEDMVDLHLGWYFLFAWGPASHGMVTRHDIDSPPMTDFLVSIFRYVDVHIPSPNYQSDASPGCLLLIVAFAFYTLMGRP